ncbi:hypothetical protein CFB43_24270 [Burkholderia sp. AU15512]|nr:hypothetical protein CFB43_24270 [Burkholderia sp. AU15512]
MRPLFRRSACVTLARPARSAAARGTRCSCVSSPSGAAGSPARRRASPIRVTHARHAYAPLGAARASSQPRHRRLLPPTGAGHGRTS